jgi:hypothetical protein
MCVCALGTCVPNCTVRSARLFFMLDTRGPQGAVGHMATPEPAPVGKRGLEPQDAWQRWSPPQPGDEVQSHKTRGSAGAHFNRKARSGAIGHVAAPEELQSHMTRGSAGAHLSREVRSGAIGHVTVCGCMHYNLS